ncbi:cyclin-dependent kinase 5 activator 1-like [Spea bombifrons]|uniref:cyclin-dependent kinase 5 activator 1-like n=1 Tax=Spea bombifrons TaxID=233779 RepID=UPI00234B7348|nr:cyclin-dependent kinase 5 activator 1-like [Spea bombifrons]
MASQNSKGRTLKRLYSFISDVPLKLFAGVLFKKRRQEGEPDSSSQRNTSDPENVPSYSEVEPASASQALKWFSKFVCHRCFRITSLKPSDPVRWLQNVDRALFLHKCQDAPFLTLPNVVFLYLVCRDVISSDLVSKMELKAALMTCLYVSCSYVGPEITYPAKFFRVDSWTDDFWNRCLTVIGAMSEKMLLINTDPEYFAQTLEHLKAEGGR